MARKQFVQFLCLILVIDALVVGALVSAKSSWKIGVPIGIGAMLFPFLLVPAVTGAIMRIGGWGTLASLFPALQAAPGTRAKMADTLSVGWVPMSNAIEYAADDNHLHLTPLITLGRWCPAVSIPWEHVSFPELGSAPDTEKAGKHVLFAVAGIKMRVPLDAVRRELDIRRAIREAESVPQSA